MESDGNSDPDIMDDADELIDVHVLLIVCRTT